MYMIESITMCDSFSIKLYKWKGFPSPLFLPNILGKRIQFSFLAFAPLKLAHIVIATRKWKLYFFFMQSLFYMQLIFI